MSIRPVGADAVAVTAWLRPDERPVWICPGVRVHYDVTGLRSNGRPERTSRWWRIARIVLFPVTVAALLLELDDLTKDRRTVTATGSHPDCQAARLADARTDRSWWVLTWQRFVFVTIDPDGRPRTVWELPADRYDHQEQPRQWVRYTYDSIVFADASKLAFVRDRRLWPST